ncbi:MAG: succinate dehydrogenase (or fumarate reductase) cytochrome b subunit, b558 family [Chthoniobacteraceae bacterium]|nr:succinate dehydrogenase (or fumarate reductase) cytochrome b subunit, b558 family [Chthoniobacteraceae bacterium]
MNFITSFYNSSIGKKWIVALTGLVLIGYVIGHMAGNLQIFAGPEKINAYAAFLHSLPGPLWVIRIFLIVCLVLHIVTTIKLAVENRSAKAQRNEYRAATSFKPAKATMVLSGLVVLAFLVLHLAHFTIRSIDPRFHELPRGEFDVHSMVILGFQNVWYSGFYIVAVFLLCMHLSHGFQSLLQTLGINSKKVRLPITYGGQALSWLIFAGYVAVPIAVLTHHLTLVP